MCIMAHGQEKSIEASSQRPLRQPSDQSPLAKPLAQTPTRPPPSKAPLKRPPTKLANKKRKKRSQRQSEISERDEDVEEDLEEEETDDVLDIDTPSIENLDREDEPLGALSDPLHGIIIASELWDNVADHTSGIPLAAFSCLHEVLLSARHLVIFVSYSSDMRSFALSQSNASLSLYAHSMTESCSDGDEDVDELARFRRTATARLGLHGNRKL
ncbi:hypothetical protein L7F22_041946 [Adiantum nelumboides]|nr:hypothetical protein [Adiantum nelumboides]